MQSKRRYGFGTKCLQCKTELIAPERSIFSHESEIRHQWRCCNCDHGFETAVNPTKAA